MMDLYEAIEVLAEFVDEHNYTDFEYDEVEVTKDEVEAMKICLEAARDKAGV